MDQKSLNQKHLDNHFNASEICFSQFIKPYNGFVSCALNMKDLNSNNFLKFRS
jgi:hypothetical protein